MKMSLTNIAQSQSNSQLDSVKQTNLKRVFEYALIVINFQTQEAQELTAAFRGIPTVLDWEAWLSGWNSCDYYLMLAPQLIDVI